MFIEDPKILPTKYLSFKSPLITSSGNIGGVFVLSFELHSDLLITLNKINELDLFGSNTQILSNSITIEQQNLTSRERQCVYLLARGNSTKNIAALLSRSPRTIDVHIEHIKQKLGCHRKSQILNKLFEET